MSTCLQVEVGDILKGLHGRQRTLCVLLQLLVIRTVLVELSFPLVHGSWQCGRIDAQEERPDLLAIEEVGEALLTADVDKPDKVGRRSRPGLRGLQQLP